MKTLVPMVTRINRKIVEAIARRNGSAAEEAARLHVRNAAKLRVQMLFGKGPN